MGGVASVGIMCTIVVRLNVDSSAAEPKHPTLVARPAAMASGTGSDSHTHVAARPDTVTAFTPHSCASTYVAPSATLPSCSQTLAVTSSDGTGRPDGDSSVGNTGCPVWVSMSTYEVKTAHDGSENGYKGRLESGYLPLVPGDKVFLLQGHGVAGHRRNKHPWYVYGVIAKEEHFVPATMCEADFVAGLRNGRPEGWFPTRCLGAVWL